MKKERKPLTKKSYIVLITSAIGIFALAFALLIVAAVLQDNEVDSTVYTVIGFSAFPVMIIALVILFSNFGRLMEYELQAKAEKVSKSGYTVIEGVTKNKIVDACIRKKFVEKDQEYYHKRKFSFSKDYVNYFVRCVECDDLESTLEKEFQKIDDKNYKNKNKCLILFLFFDSVTKRDLDTLKEQSTVFIVLENGDTAVIVLVDKSNGKAYFVPPRKFSISVYKNGIKMIEKLTSQENKM